ncbi:acetate/propionate family kinase [Rubinisphaera margarita]|uniref:acetate/propionate family kinase n=1 Tax=Rubinisphaera margarita TaxID=2909586 RepID=UPI001EE99624|nr:acetate/propionate family kinase [Rubinisphaera margarita]MCG6156838.1 acetate/propionate family kinase [Rubinisphaera margarita]
MKILVANLGSTSFKYRLFDMETEAQLARGGIDRIGQPGVESCCVVEIGSHKAERNQVVPDHATAVQICLEQLTDAETGCLKSVEEVAAIGFKAVFAGKLSGVRRVNDELLEMMEVLSDVAPAHNPPYVKAMRELQSAFPNMPLVAALETGFHETIPEANRLYAVPYEWKEDYAIQRWGFHGASHRFIGQRAAELLGREDLKIVSCHLGGSSSLCAQKGGQSQATTMGMTPQTGLPQNNRVGDFDAFALPLLMKSTGKSLEELLADLSKKGGLFGLSGGLSSDARDLEEAAGNGHEGAQRALDVYVANIRHYIGAYMATLEGIDAIVFTGGIGENSQYIREHVCAGFEWAGLKLDADKNAAGRGKEGSLAAADSEIDVWIIPTNEELVVARQSLQLINNG